MQCIETEMLLNTLPHTRHPPTAKNYLDHGVNSVQVG